MRLSFGEFSLDTARRKLSERGAPIHLTPKAFDLLVLLIDGRAKVLSKEEIHREIWGESVVDESNLAVLIADLRRALRDESKHPRFIKTVHRYGYGFVSDVTPEVPEAAIRIRAGSRDYDLIDGENIIGRDVQARVRLNAPGISRQHARITVSGGRATIEDLGSKNGTFLDGSRVEAPRELRHGSEIRLSREVLFVLIPRLVDSTITDIR